LSKRGDDGQLGTNKSRNQRNNINDRTSRRLGGGRATEKRGGGGGQKAFIVPERERWKMRNKFIQKSPLSVKNRRTLVKGEEMRAAAGKKDEGNKATLLGDKKRT